MEQYYISEYVGNIRVPSALDNVPFTNMQDAKDACRLQFRYSRHNAKPRYIIFIYQGTKDDFNLMWCKNLYGEVNDPRLVTIMVDSIVEVG